MSLIDTIPIVRGSGRMKIGKRSRISGRISVHFDDPNSVGQLIIGDQFTSNANITLSPRGGTIYIGNNVFIGQNSIIQSYKGTTISIGNNVMIAPGSMIFGSNHSTSVGGLPMRLQPESSIGIKIGDDVWVGAGAAIMDGIEIGRGTIIAAGAVVTKSIGSYCVVGGVPAKIISKRLEEV